MITEMDKYMTEKLLQLAGPPPTGCTTSIQSNGDILIWYGKKVVGHIYYTVVPRQDTFCYGYGWKDGQVARYNSLKDAITSLATKHRMLYDG